MSDIDSEEPAVERGCSYSVSCQKRGSCWNMVIARLLRRTLFHYYRIVSVSSIDFFYNEKNFKITTFLNYRGYPHDMDHETRNYELFSGAFHLLLFNFAIQTKIETTPTITEGLIRYLVDEDGNRVVFDERNGGNTFYILKEMIRKLESMPTDEDFVYTFVKRLLLMDDRYGYIHTRWRDVYNSISRFIIQILVDMRSGELELQLFSHRMDKQVTDQIIENGPNEEFSVEFIDGVKYLKAQGLFYPTLVVRLLRHYLSEGYYGAYHCRNPKDVDKGHVVLIVDKKETYNKETDNMEKEFIVKDSNGRGECNWGYMNIKKGMIPDDDTLFEHNVCGMFVLFPRKLHGEEDTCGYMLTIVLGTKEPDTGLQRTMSLTRGRSRSRSKSRSRSRRRTKSLGGENKAKIRTLKRHRRRFNQS